MTSRGQVKDFAEDVKISVLFLMSKSPRNTLCPYIYSLNATA